MLMGAHGYTLQGMSSMVHVRPTYFFLCLFMHTDVSDIFKKGLNNRVISGTRPSRYSTCETVLTGIQTHALELRAGYSTCEMV